MNVNTKVNSSIETKKEKEVNTFPVSEEETEILTNVNATFSDVLSGQISNDGNIKQSILSMPIDYNYDSLFMDIQDAVFFVNLAQDEQYVINTTENGEFKSLLQLDVSKNIISQKTISTTNQLTTLIEKAQNTQKPVRISFDNDVSVILKIDKHGKITAEFIPGNIEVENYLRNNIASLRQKFDEQNLPYNDLFYRQQNGKQNKNRNKEKGEQ